MYLNLNLILTDSALLDGFVVPLFVLKREGHLLMVHHLLPLWSIYTCLFHRMTLIYCWRVSFVASQES
jgi:hypothetical protein